MVRDSGRPAAVVITDDMNPDPAHFWVPHWALGDRPHQSLVRALNAGDEDDIVGAIPGRLPGDAVVEKRPGIRAMYMPKGLKQAVVADLGTWPQPTAWARASVEIPLEEPTQEMDWLDMEE